MRLMALNWTRWSRVPWLQGQGSTARKVQRLPLARATNIAGTAHWRSGDQRLSLEERRSASILSGTGRPSGGPVVASQRPLLRLKLMRMNLMNNGSSGVASELRFVATGRSFARNHPEPIVKHY